MYVKSTRPSAKRDVQKERSAKRDDRIARPRRAQICERSELRAKRAMRMCPRSGQIFLFVIMSFKIETIRVEVVNRMNSKDPCLQETVSKLRKTCSLTRRIFFYVFLSDFYSLETFVLYRAIV